MAIRTVDIGQDSSVTYEHPTSDAGVPLTVPGSIPGLAIDYLILSLPITLSIINLIECEVNNPRYNSFHNIKH